MTSYEFFRVTPPSLFAPGQSCVAACSWSNWEKKACAFSGATRATQTSMRPDEFRLLLSMPEDVADACIRDEDPQAARDEYCRMLRYNEALAAAKRSH